MNKNSRRIQSIYLYLILGNTLAASLIWGINTIFLLDAGLSNFQAFLANAFFTLGEVIFEVPTGIVADSVGRRTSYLLGAFTLMLSTGLYYLMWYYHGPFIGWALSSMLLGLGFTFFSGALEAWLVDALHATNFTGSLEGVFSKGQIAGGIAMLIGSVAGGFIAERTSLGVPYLLRSFILVINFYTAFFLMKDVGFSPKKMERPLQEIGNIFNRSVKYGLRNPPVKWLMIASVFTAGVSFYIFYALQPFLLQLYGNPKAYGIAGLAAALVALAQITGGIIAPHLRKLFRTRTGILLSGIIASTALLILVSFIHVFWIVLALVFVWGILFAAMTPIRQTYINGLIPSSERATVLSFDSLMGSAGGIFVQPVLGKIADVGSYALSYFVAACMQAIAIPFIYFAKNEKAPSDIIAPAKSPLKQEVSSVSG